MSFFHKKNVTKCLGHHYAIWTSDSNFLLALISGTEYGHLCKAIGFYKYIFICLKILFLELYKRFL